MGRALAERTMKFQGTGGDIRVESLSLLTVGTPSIGMPFARHENARVYVRHTTGERHNIASENTALMGPSSGNRLPLYGGKKTQIDMRRKFQLAEAGEQAASIRS